jgi:cell division protein FtsW
MSAVPAAATMCAPIAHDIYETILEKKKAPPGKSWRRQIENVFTGTTPREAFDRLQIAALVGLMFIGTAFVFSATMVNDRRRKKPWYAQTGCGRSSWYALGIGAAAALCVVDYHTLARWSFVAYWAMILCLVAVLIPHIGSMRTAGARRWIDLGFFQFQPSEFAKLAFILAAQIFEPAAG